ncbi:MAG TPA: hypothetical protein VL990_09340 [Acidobacteriaceae bacterium]|nr:hypothetical protein [Acidobacteriaceae bacterium]
MALWEVRTKPGYEPSQVIEADSVSLDAKKTAAIFFGDDAQAEAIIALTPGMTITKKK